MGRTSLRSGARFRVVLAWLVAMLALTPFLATAAAAQDGSAVQPRANIVSVDAIIAPSGELWLRLHFEEPWGEEPPFDLFSMFFGIGGATETEQSASGWEWHDSVARPLESTATRPDLGAAALDDGTVIVGTGLFPEDRVDLIIYMASWLDETTTERQADQFELSLDGSQFMFGDPFHLFGAFTYDLVRNTPFVPATTSTTSSPTTTVAPTTSSSAPTTSSSAVAATGSTAALETPASDGGDSGFPGLTVALTAGGAVIVGGGAYGLSKRKRTPADPTPPTTPQAAPPPAVPTKEDESESGVTIGVVSNGGTDSVHQYQVFRVVVELPLGEGDPPETIDIELSAESGDDETLTLAWEGNATGRPRYVSQPITLDKGAMGEGSITVFGMEFAVGGFEGLWFRDRDELTISFGGASTTLLAYNSWVQQGLGRAMAVIAYWKAFWGTLLEELEGVEGPQAETARANARRGLEWAAKAEKWFERDDALDTTKLAWVHGYAGSIGQWYEDPRDALQQESQIGRWAREGALSNRERVITENGYQIALGLTKTIAEATFAGAGFTLLFGQTIEGREATWDEQVLAAFELAGWAGLAAGLDARGLGDIAAGRTGRPSSRGLESDPRGVGSPTVGRGADPFSTPDNPWSHPVQGAVDDFNPAGTLDDIGPPGGATRHPPTAESAARTQRQKDQQIPKVESGFSKDVYVHGSARGAFLTDSGQPVSVSGLARQIQDSGDWRPGVPIRLVACHSAHSGAAAALAARLKTKVRAPTHRVYIKSDGSFGFLGEPKPRDPNFPDVNPGHSPAPPEAGWIEFDETGREIGRIDQAGNYTPTGGGS